MENNKKTLINSKIAVEDLEKYSKIIVKKALKVMACSGSMYAIELLEGKDKETEKDLQQEIALQLILDNYIINKNTFKVVRSYIYRNKEKTETSLFLNEEEEEKATEKVVYISYLQNDETEKKKASKIDTKKLLKKLSETEKKIYYYYFINNMKQKDIAKMTETTKSNINILIKRIKQKAVECLEG